MNSTINFLGEETQDYQSAKIVIFPCPYEKSTSYMKGTSLGPLRILEASEQVEFFDTETESEPSQAGIFTFPIFDYSSGTEKDCLSKTQVEMEKAYRDHKFVVTFGGEHTISLPSIRAAADVFGHQNLSILHFDAHSDVRESYEKNPLSHASVMRRVHEFIDYTYSIGIRAQCIEEQDYLKKNTAKFGVLYDHQRARNGISLQEAEKYLITEKVYITIDLDYFSPDEVPGVGTPVPGGGNWYETLGFLKQIFKNRDIVGFDIVELKPESNKRSDFFAAQLAYKLMAYKFS